MDIGKPPARTKPPSSLTGNTNFPLIFLFLKCWTHCKHEPHKLVLRTTLMLSNLFLLNFQVGGTVIATCLKGILSKMIKSRKNSKNYAGKILGRHCWPPYSISLHGQNCNSFKAPVKEYPSQEAWVWISLSVLYSARIPAVLKFPSITINNKHVSI